ncbi:hypothetical protein OUZ56_018416 [Daphnia magna]|uniref:Uncharacterized protein n=1 Tax=Daphnia magna TaxID=35525 RepID=A0ABQ9Z8S7_9CRUS|nr:hypothetical protein OUZ56_018416 [Daphnia magna]
MELTTDPQTMNLKHFCFLTEEEALLMEKEPPSEEDLMMANIKKHMVYNLCGYVLNTLETSFALLPDDFYEAVATKRKDRGGLKYCTKEMFNLFVIVEDVYREEVNVGSLNILDWFERTMDTLGCLAKKKKFNIEVFCELHRSELVGKLVLEYLIIRNYLETKKWVWLTQI